MNKLIAKLNNKKLLIVSLGILVLAGGLLFFNKIGKETPEPSVAINQVSDESLGLKFAISKDFERIPTQELISQNPSFVYGFRPKGITDVSCIVSQTQRLKPGVVSVDELAQGTFDQIRQSYPDVEDKVSKKVTIAGREAAWLELVYTEDGKKVKQTEVVTTTDVRTTFAFCACPEPLASIYQDVFNSFLNSLSIN